MLAVQIGGRNPSAFDICHDSRLTLPTEGVVVSWVRWFSGSCRGRSTLTCWSAEVLDHANARRDPRPNLRHINLPLGFGPMLVMIPLCYLFCSAEVDSSFVLAGLESAAILCAFGASLAFLRVNSMRRAVS